MTLIFVFDFCLECALTEAREAIVRALGDRETRLGRPNGGNVQLSEVQKQAEKKEKEKAKNKAKNKTKRQVPGHGRIGTVVLPTPGPGQHVVGTRV